MSGEERILICAPVGRDGPLAATVLREAGMDAVACSGMGELARELEAGAAAVLLTEEALAGGGKPLLDFLNEQPPWSDLPVIVFGDASDTLGALSNLTQLDRPVRIRTMVSTVQAALRARRRQYQARALLQTLEQSVRDRDNFLAMLGHELRNPLAAVLTASELLDRLGSPASARERAVIGRQTRHLARLVDDLLDVARVTSGKIVLHRGQVDLNEVISRAAQALQAAAHRQKVQVSIRPAQGRLMVTGDSVRLEQVAANLLGNAIKYTPAGGRVVVEAREAGSPPQAVLRVRDSGAGIPAETLPRVFDMFVQAPGTLERAQGGMGIGLTLVKRLVELHGGKVSAKSDGPGKGSEFEVRLPRSHETSDAPPAPHHPPPSARTVLVVEDNADSREVLQLALQQMGHRVLTSGDGAAAVDSAISERPDAMIVDLGLPGKDGYEVARAVRAALGAAVRLVALTGYGQPDDRARAAQAGFDVFLTKPAEMDAIEAALALEMR